VDDFVSPVADSLEQIGVSDPLAIEENSLIDVLAALHRVDRRRSGIPQILGSSPIALNAEDAIPRAREPLDVILFVLRAFLRDEVGVQRSRRIRERLERLVELSEV